MAKLSENSLKVLNFVRENGDKNITAADIEKGTGLSIKSVNGIVTSAFQRKGLMERIPAEMEYTDEDGNVKHKDIKLIRLTEAGKSFDENAVEEAE
jgi:hypothetical protein